MTREEFIEELKEKGYSYEIEGNKVIVTHKGNVDLRDLTSLPPGVVFKNEAGVNLNSLGSLSPDVDFKNWGHVYLRSLISLLPEVEFRNGGSVYLGSVMGWFYQWEGNIEGINKNRLLNLMIKQGVFDKNKR
jgi:hypothetical protein